MQAPLGLGGYIWVEQRFGTRDAARELRSDGPPESGDAVSDASTNAASSSESSESEERPPSSSPGPPSRRPPSAPPAALWASARPYERCGYSSLSMRQLPRPPSHLHDALKTTSPAISAPAPLWTLSSRQTRTCAVLDVQSRIADIADVPPAYGPSCQGDLLGSRT